MLLLRAGPQAELCPQIPSPWHTGPVDTGTFFNTTPQGLALGIETVEKLSALFPGGTEDTPVSGNAHQTHLGDLWSYCIPPEVVL